MTSPQPPRPQTRVAAGAALNEETLHLPLTTTGPSSAQRPTAPGPYPPRPPYRQTEPAPHPAAPRPRETPRWEGMGFRPDIQGLRAIAVGLVLLSHAGFPGFAGGYVGVDVFFVLSGFLITSLLVKEVFETGRISLAGFYARRARRILPAASAVVIATVIGAWLWFPITRFEAVMQDAFTVIVYIVNYRFIAESTEYLNADQMPSPFQQYWSLAVEEQFYVVWPLLLIGLLFLVGRAPRRFLGAAIGFSVVIFVVTLILSVLITEQSQPTAYYAAHTRAWELAGGAFLALTLPTWKKLPAALAWVFAIGGLGAIIASGLMYSEETAFPGYTALAPVLGTMAVIMAGTAQGKNAVTSLLGTQPFQFVGKISYSLYLWHWPILILAPLALDVEPRLMLNLVLLAGTFAAAQLSYAYIEEPFRNAKLLKRSNAWGLATGVLCSLVGIGLIVALTTTFTKVPEDNGPTDLEAVEEVGSQDEVTEALEAGLEVTSVPDDLTPALATINGDRPKIYDNGCHLDFEDVQPADGCVYGKVDSDTVIYLMGDSHAAQWFPALEAIADEQGWKLVTRTKSACTPVSVTVENSQLEREYSECDDWRDTVFDEFDEVKPDLVVLSTSDAASIANPESDGGVEEWKTGWEDTLERVTASAENTLALTDTPRTGGDPAPDCIALNEESVQECTPTEDDGIGYDERRAAGIEAGESAGADVIDTVDWFCVDGKCPLIVEDMMVLRDGHHVSTPYAKYLSGVLEDALPDLK
ncbi:acyltransferase family protein [Glycomyces buryatensis]|uniref:Acyltransferase n=1 Tax=Glycomyces buryatensis TaxID=2570927 RepID=A0A4S8QJL9_9ACTN|nr:acyltransferase family protein [Glycomyces buryatensis]THV43472.1 acyltransferase [Glycomyces buryatensis]